MNVDELFKKGLQNSEVNPPDAVWDKILSKLPQGVSGSNNLDSLTQTLSTSAKVAPLKAVAKMATWKIVSIVAAVVSVVAATVVIVTMNMDNYGVNENLNVNNPIEETPVFAEVDSTDIDNFENNVSDGNDVSSFDEVKENNSSNSIKTTDTKKDETPLSCNDDKDKKEEKDDVTNSEPNLDVADAVEKEQPVANEPLVESPDTLIDMSDKTQTQENISSSSENDDISAEDIEKLNELMSTSDVDVPNVITPNNDGINDCWIIPGLEKYNSVHVVVVAPNGKKVYENKKYDNSWCPTDLPDGSYFYFVQIRDGNYKPKQSTLYIKNK